MNKAGYIITAVFLALHTIGVCAPIQKSSYLRADSVLKLMTLDEKVGQLMQCSGEFATGPNMEKIDRIAAIKAGRIGSMLNVLGVDNVRRMQAAAMESRMRIPLIFALDVIHGYTTIFPLPLAEAASFDLEAIELSARCAALETSAGGVNWTFAPMVDVGWDARWGRVMEGAGEDPYWGSLVAKARVKGFQGDDLGANNTILACAKHFAGYGAAVAGKDYNSVDMSMGHFANYYMAPFKACVDAGAGTFMSAFNDFNNVPCTTNEFLLRDLLKNRWDFQGFVVSDWASVEESIWHRYSKDHKHAAENAIKAGLDMEMVSECYLKNLADLVKEQKVDIKLVDDAVRRILTLKFELGLFDDPYRYLNNEREKQIVGSKQMRDAACKVAERSIVLLKNAEHVLPLSKATKSVALIGGLNKSQKDMFGAWGGFRNRVATTVFEAMSQRGVEVNYCDGYDLETNELLDWDETLAQVQKSDVVVIAMGERANQSGEMRSRADITINVNQQELVSRLVKTGKPVVVLMMAGRPAIFNRVREEASAILYTWWLGSEAGTAICNVLWGDYNPSAKLPMTFPSHVGQVPIYYQYKSTGRPEAPDGWSTRYTDISYLPAYPFGYGLSYGEFNYSNLKVSSEKMTMDGKIKVSVDVRNNGKHDGYEAVQLYIKDMFASVTRPVKELKGFKRIRIKSGETINVSFEVDKSHLGFYNNAMEFVIEPGEFEIQVGKNSAEVLKQTFELL